MKIRFVQLCCLLIMSIGFPDVVTGQIDTAILNELVLHCGQNDDKLLSSKEAIYFNILFEKERGIFDFQNKKVAFYSDPNGLTASCKSDYFSASKSEIWHQWQADGTQLIVLSKQNAQKLRL